MNTAIQFEEKLMSCLNITGDLKDVAEFIGDQDMSKAENIDRVLNSLNGIHDLYEMKFSKMLNVFEQLVKEYYSK
jgi:flagellar capping protein FliD